VLILVATDGSEHSDRAVDMAARLAKAAAAKLLVITVGDRFAGEGLERLARAEGGIGEALELVSSQILRHAAARAREHSVSSIETRFCWGEPAKVIEETAQQMSADAIVVGRRGHGRSLLHGLFLGSVSQELVSRSDRPVLVVP